MSNHQQLLNSEINESNISLLLEQYKVYIDAANQTSTLRSQANTFFITINTVLVAFIAGILEFAGEPSTSIWILLTCIAGIILGISWYTLLTSYRRLNSRRFTIIGEIEAHLPARLFAYEWELLTKDDAKKHIRLSMVEQTIPIAFTLLFLGLGITSLILKA